LLPRTDVGEGAALSQAARLLERSGRGEEAMGLYRRAAEAGDRDALGYMARLLEKTDRVDEAVELYLRAAQADHDAVR
jgi:tetratricopeptide (TPR) repeat protein